MPKKQLDGLSIILDRDGTIIKDKHYLSDPDGVELLPGAASALRILNLAGADLFIVTNQSGIGRGYFDEPAYAACSDKLLSLLEQEGIGIKHTTYCPHAPEENCLCRKPAAGMWEEIRSKFQLSPSRTVMIGDKMDDIRFGINNNFAASILVLTGHGKETAKKYSLPAPCLVNDAASCEICNTDHLAKTLHSPGSKPLPDMPHAIAVNLSAAAAWVIQNMRRDG